jgi:hypothetical protein
MSIRALATIESFTGYLITSSLNILGLCGLVVALLVAKWLLFFFANDWEGNLTNLLATMILYHHEIHLLLNIIGQR